MDSDQEMLSSSSSEDEIGDAIADRDDFFIDTQNPLWFPPGVTLRTHTNSYMPPHNCWSHRFSTELWAEDAAVNNIVIKYQHDRQSCDFQMSAANAQDWVNALTAYPAYITMTYSAKDRQEMISSDRGHLIRELVPPQDVTAQPRLNLASLANMPVLIRWHSLRHAIAPPFPCHHFLTEMLIKHMAMPSTMEMDRKSDLERPPTQLSRLTLAKDIVKRRYQSVHDNAEKQAQRDVDRSNNRDNMLVFDLVCTHLLTSSEFDNNLPGLRYDCISDYIPWTMIARYMDPAQFTWCTLPWIQTHQFLSWSLLSYYNFNDNARWSNEYFKTYPDQKKTYFVSKDSVMPWCGSVGFYAGFFNTRLIFAVDNRVRHLRQVVREHGWSQHLGTTDFDYVLHQ